MNVNLMSNILRQIPQNIRRIIYLIAALAVAVLLVVGRLTDGDAQQLLDVIGLLLGVSASTLARVNTPVPPPAE